MAKEKKSVDDVFDKVEFLYARGAIVNLDKNPRYPCKVSSNRPSIDYVTDGGFPKGRLILIAGEPSAGKCLGKGTEVLMYDGTHKKVEDIVLGDIVMGVNSLPRIVCNTSKGVDNLYKINQKQGIDYVVNSNHILTLIKVSEPKFSRYTNEYGKRVYDYSKEIRGRSEELVNINIQDLLKEYEKAPVNFRRKFFGIKRPDLRYDKKQLTIEPYLLGLWLGDGTSNKPEISNIDEEVINYIKEYAINNDQKLTVYSSNSCGRYNLVTERGKDNPFLINLQNYNLIGNKHIPIDYMTSDLEDRLNLLAGILDSDGSLDKRRKTQSFDISQKNETLLKSIKQLAESCGFICSEVSKQKKNIKSINFEGYYFRISFTGNLSIIPTKVERKKASFRQMLDSDYRTSVSIEHIGEGEYYGFGLDGDEMFMLKDQTVTHNSSLTIQIAEEIGNKILYADTEATLTTDYILSLGATPSKFDHFIPETTESMCDIIRQNIQKYDVIIVDSINNSASGEQLQKTAGERTMANRAIVMASQLPILIGLANQYNTTLIILSQVRDNMDKSNKYSPDTVIPGGRSLHHNSSLTLELFKSSKKEKEEKGTLGNKDKVIEGNMVRIKCTKNKVGKVNREVTVEFTYGLGYTIEADIASAAKRLGILEMAGSWVKYKGTSIAQGIDNLVPMLFDNPELLEELRIEVNNKINNDN